MKAELRQAIADLKAEIAARHGDLLKWMFLYWAGTALTVIGLLKLRYG